MKYALVAMIISMLFAIQSAFAAAPTESALEIAEDLIDASELPRTLPKEVKKAPKTSDVALEEQAEDAVEIAAPNLENAESVEKEESAELPTLDERQPAAAEDTMVATLEAPGTLGFDMATIDMIPDAPETEPLKNNFSEVARSR